MNITARVKDIITDPVHFFSRIKKERGVNNALAFLLVLSVIPAVMGSLIQFSFHQIFGINLIYGAGSAGTLGFPFDFLFTFPGIIFFGIGSYILGILLTFVVAAILHVWIMIFDGKGDYGKTFQTFVYANTPNYLFSWIPFLGFFTWIWNLILLIIATEKTHKVTRAKSVLIYLLPLGLVILFIMLIFIIFMGLVFAGAAQNIFNS